MNLVNEAALLAARRGKRVVTRQEFEDSRDKIMMGAERRTLIMTEEEKRLTAYHEAGHALVSVSMPASTPIHKATIIPRGRALGMVQSLPERDQISQSYEQLIAMLAMSMGGRVAEELMFGKDKVTSGAAGDIQQVTKIARAMVTRLGFSDKLGTVMYGENQDEVFLGYSLGRQQNISEATAETIDQEVRRLVQEAHDTATRILTERRADLETLAAGLMEFETLTGDEIVGLLQGVRPVRESATDREPPAARAPPCPRPASRGRSVRRPAGSSRSRRPDRRFRRLMRSRPRRERGLCFLAGRRAGLRPASGVARRFATRPGNPRLRTKSDVFCRLNAPFASKIVAKTLVKRATRARFLFRRMNDFKSLARIFLPRSRRGGDRLKQAPCPAGFSFSGGSDITGLGFEGDPGIIGLFSAIDKILF